MTNKIRRLIIKPLLALTLALPICIAGHVSTAEAGNSYHAGKASGHKAKRNYRKKRYVRHSGARAHSQGKRVYGDRSVRNGNAKRVVRHTSRRIVRNQRNVVQHRAHNGGNRNHVVRNNHRSNVVIYNGGQRNMTRHTTRRVVGHSNRSHQYSGGVRVNVGVNKRIVRQGKPHYHHTGGRRNLCSVSH